METLDCEAINMWADAHIRTSLSGKRHHLTSDVAKFGKLVVHNLDIPTALIELLTVLFEYLDSDRAQQAFGRA